MAVKAFNSIAGFSTGDPSVIVIQANADITTVNLTANGVSNLGAVSNLILTGGTANQVLKTDGAGNLSFTTISSSGISNGTSNVNIPTSGGNVTVSVGGTANVAVFTSTEANLLALNVQGVSNLGNIGNVRITGGNSNQYIRTDGAGNLTFDSIANISSNVVSTMPYLIPTGESYILNANFQGLYSNPITIDGELTVDGMLIEILDTIQSSPTQVLFDTNGVATGNTGFTFLSYNGNLNVPGNLNAVGQVVATGNTIAGNVFANSGTIGANLLTGTLTTAAQPNITSVGTLTSLTVSGTITGTVSSATTAGTVTTAAQPNITSVGTLTDLSVSGNGTIDGNLVVNGNLIYVNVEELAIEDPIINLQTGPNGAPLVSNTNKDVGSALNYYDTQARIAFMGWDTSNAEFAFGSQTTISSEIVTFDTLGNIRAQTFKGNIEATTIAGNLTTATQSNITTVGTLGSLNVTGNIAAGNFTSANVVTANYLISNSGCVSINGALLAYDNSTHSAGIFSTLATDINFGLAANITAGSTAGTTTIRGNLIVNNNVYANTGTVKGSLLTGTLTTASQPNITSLGTLTSLSVTGNISANNAIANTVTTNSTISKRANVAVTTDTVIDSFSTSAYRTAKYVIKSKNDDGYESLEVLLIHNNINSFVTVYAAINDGGGNTVSITTGISSSNVELRATGLGANTVVNLIGTYVPD